MSAPAMAEFMSSTGLVHATEPGGPKRASLVVNDSKVVSMDAKNDVYGSCSQRTKSICVSDSRTHNNANKL